MTKRDKLIQEYNNIVRQLEFCKLEEWTGLPEEQHEKIQDFRSRLHAEEESLEDLLLIIGEL